MKCVKNEDLNIKHTIISEIYSMNFETFLKNPVKNAESITPQKLTTFLRKISASYYNSSKSLVSDKIFDELKDILTDKDPTNEFLDEVGAPVTGKKVKLPFPMGSLDKVKPDNNKFEKWASTYEGPYILSDKMDGISALLHNDGNELKLYTRGNGIFGQDISHLIQYLKLNVPQLPENTAVRGELIISKKDFEKIKEKDDSVNNARNTTAGIVNDKTICKNARYVQFITYTVVFPSYKQSKQFNLLEKWGFKTAPHKMVKSISVESLQEYFKERRGPNDFDIDGIVVIDDSNAYDIVVGNPKYGFAFKSIQDDQIAIATVVDVEWEISRYGYLKPTIKIEPIKLVGVTITYATAHNAKFVHDNNIGIGAKIKIIRSGDVIPKIMEVIEPSKNGKPKMPDIAYEWNETEVDIIATNKDDRKKIISIKKIVNFMETLNVKYINEGIVTKLYDAGFTSVIKIIKSDKADISDVIGDKMTDKITDNLMSALKNTQLHTLMNASNCFDRGMGEKKLAVILKAYPTIMTDDITDKELFTKIMSLDGFQEKTTEKFIGGFNKFKLFLVKMNKYVDMKYLLIPDVKKTGTKLAGQKIVMTGFRDNTLKDFIESNGGETSTSVSKNTTLVICADDCDTSSAKYVKAEELKIKIMTQSEFKKKYV